MTPPVPTFSQIKAQVAAIQQKAVSSYEAIGIHAPGRWTGAQRQEADGKLYLIYPCDSPLAVRLALRDPVEVSATKVLITPLDEQSLDQDILLRLAKGTLFPINSWQIAKTLFGATTVDPRLLQHRWMADMLLDGLAADEYPTVNGGFLDAETVWPLLLRQGMGLKTSPLDLRALLEWSIHPDHIAHYQSASPAFKAAAMDWISQGAGAAARLVLTCAETCERPDTAAVGLALDVIFNPNLGHQLDRAKGKLEERFLNGVSPSPASLAAWSQAAADLLRSGQISLAQQTQLVQRADEILTELGAEPWAYLSTTSDLGFTQRLARFGQALMPLLETPNPTTLGDVTTTYEAIQAHRQARPSAQPKTIERRLDKMAMALRLARWLVQETQNPAPDPQDLTQAIQYHLQEGSFLDWARLSLRSGDPLGDLSAAYQALFDRVTTVRERHSHQFAQRLQNWVDLGTEHTGFIPIEAILDTVVAPLASQGPILAIVLDGMGMAVARELLASLQAEDWRPLVPPDHPTALLAGLATLPSITETSRASLLCGDLTSGDQALEKRQFTTHSALVATCRRHHPPLLFHKGTLQDSQDVGLASPLRESLGNTQNRVIGVVLNAVDDYLAKGEQLDVAWTPQEIKVLPALLHEAKMAGRWIILLSDHGHILDSGMTYTAAHDGERWRSADSPPTDQELALQGQRVVIPPSHQIIAPWSEQLRYKPKKTGYHGGINPQEMIVPVVVLSPALAPSPKSWVAAPLDTPLWWHPYSPSLHALTQPTPETASPNLSFQAQPTHSELGPLFNLIPLEPIPETTPAPEIPAWVSYFLASPTYQAQRQLAGRLAPDETLITRLLTSFATQGYTLPLTLLSRTLNQSPDQLQTLMPSFQRILNIDGYAVLTYDGVFGQNPRSNQTATLNHNLLRQQFDISFP
ncbi:MAG: BREX-2 system phosphatase PglZ [Leptolyngbya sp.]|nr:BREX-2 system phosphatase PglZ [Leptolyngbya sp.]